MKAKLFFDGASKGNPGPAGYGFVIEINNTKIEGKGYIGISTNNVAEYYGLIEGLQRALKEGIKSIEIFADSQLVVKQIKGEYKVKAPHLKPLYSKATELLKKFDDAHIFFVGREKNSEADRLANLAIKEGQRVGRSLASKGPEESPGPTGQGAG